jgi:hypothetical protein
LIAARFLKGMTAAFSAPSAASIITTTFPEGPARNRALGVLGLIAAGGFSLGLVLSGLLTAIDWRWTLLMPAIVSGVLVFAVLRFVPNDGSPPKEGRSYDVGGALTSTGAILLLVYAVVQAPEIGWTSPMTWGSLALVVVLLVAFVIIEMRTSQPLVRLGILRSGTLVRTNLCVLIFFGCYVGFQFIVTQYMQRLLGWSAMQTAMAFLPAAVIVGAMSLRMAPIVQRFGTGKLILGGFLAEGAGFAVFLRADVTPDLAGVVLPCMVLLGIGSAMCITSLNIQATSGVAPQEQGLASGLFGMSSQLGSAMGLTMVAAIQTANEVSGHSTKIQMLHSYIPSLGSLAATAALGVVVSVPGLRRGQLALMPRHPSIESTPAIVSITIPAAAAPALAFVEYADLPPSPTPPAAGPHHITTAACRAVSAGHANNQGLARATVTVLPDLPAEYAQGLYAKPATYQASVRFANGLIGIKPTAPLDAICGMGIKLFVDNTTTLDYNLINNPTFFCNSVHDYLLVEPLLAKLPEAVTNEPGYRRWLYDFLTSLGRLPCRAWRWDEVASIVSYIDNPRRNPLGYSYWTIGATRHGDYVAKIRARPVREPEPVSANVREALVTALGQDAHQFDLQVQLCTDPALMPVDNPAREWPQEQSPFVTVARIDIPRQDISSPNNLILADAMTIAPWRSRPRHRPLGELMVVRRAAERQPARNYVHHQQHHTHGRGRDTMPL